LKDLGYYYTPSGCYWGSVQASEWWEISTQINVLAAGEIG